MDRSSLLEGRRHGRADFPVGFYRIERSAGETTILDSHWHAETEFLAVESGKAAFQIGLSAFEVHAGEVLYIPGGELHGGYPLDGSPCTYSAVVFDLDWLAGSQDGAAAKFLRPLQRGEIALPMHWKRNEARSTEASRGLAELTELGLAENDPALELRVKGGLYLLFAEIFGAGLASRREPWGAAESATPERLKQALSYIEDHFSRKMTVREMAGAAGMSEGHFSRMFKTFLRMTPIAYLNRIRLRHAADLLRRPGVTVTEAAMESGFDNFSYFSKMFASEYGCKPSEYRRNG